MSKEGLHIICDIKSSRVTCALVECFDIPRILFKSTKSNENHPYLSAQLMSYVVEDLYKLGKRYITNQKLPSAITSVDIIFSSPLAMSDVKTIKIHKEKPILVNERYIENRISNDLHDTKDHKIIEKKLLSIILDKEVCDESFPKNATDIELAIQLGLVDEKILKSVLDTIKERFNTNNVSVHTFPFIAEEYVKKSNPDIHDYIFVELSEENGTSIHVRDGAMCQTKQIDLGTDLFVQAVSEEFHVDNRVAQSCLNMYFDQNVDSRIEKKVTHCLDKVRDELIREIREVYDSFKAVFPLPKHIFLLVDSLYVPIMRKIIEDACEKYDSNLFHVIPIDTMSMRCQFNQDVHPDVYIGLETSTLCSLENN